MWKILIFTTGKTLVENPRGVNYYTNKFFNLFKVYKYFEEHSEPEIRAPQISWSNTKHK